MSGERAMELYVDELKKIIETMSYTDNVAEFMGSISQLNGIDVDDLEAVAPDAIKKVKSHPNSPFGKHCRQYYSDLGQFKIVFFLASREASPIRTNSYRNGNGKAFNEIVNHVLTNGNHSNENLYTNGHSLNDQSDDEYIDTVEVCVYNVLTLISDKHLYGF